MGRWDPPCVFSHATNSQAALEQAFTDRVAMIEADVLLSQGSGAAIMAHPPATESDLSLAQFLSAVAAFNQEHPDEAIGVKLDYKDPAAVPKSLDEIGWCWAAKEGPGAESSPTGAHATGAPIWLNADILPGPGGKPTKFAAQQFIDACGERYPAATLSLGWTVTVDPVLSACSYSEADADAMLALCQKNRLKGVTFAVSALHAQQSPGFADRLLAEPGATITFWGEADGPISAYVRSIDPARTYIDTKPATWYSATLLWIARLWGYMR